MKPSPLRRVFSTDHKVIAKQYLWTGLVMAALGGYLAYVMRRQLAHPGEPVPGYGAVGPDAYNAIVTMHGTIMVFWVAMPILVGAFGNFLIPLMVGAGDMAFPRLNMLSYWAFFLSTLVLLASFLAPGGAAASGWTAYPPLSTGGTPGNAVGQVLWLLALAIEFASILMGGVNYLTTPLNLRARGLGLFELPLVVWMEMAATFLFMLSVGPLIAGAVLMILDLTAGAGVYRSDPLLWQHLFWFFGHPEVYVIVLPAIGIVGEVLPVHARKPLFGYRMIIYSTLAAGVLSFVVWAHHQFLSGMDPRLAAPFSITTIIISVPFAVILFSFVATLWRGSIRFSPAMLFAVGMLAEFFVGGTTGILNGSAAADIYVHDTYYVVGHFHFTLFPAVIFGTFAGLYHWWPKMFGRPLDAALGTAHFWGTAFFFNMVFLPFFAMGFAGHHRRIYDPSLFPFLESLQGLQRVATHGLYGLLLFQVPFLLAAAKGLRGPRTAPANPWEANTLEWLAPSPPGHGNFEAAPVVRRGPYDYGVEGPAGAVAARDHRPQWE